MGNVIFICGSFVVCLLPHDSDALVRSLNSDGLDLADRDTIDRRLVISALVPLSFVSDGLHLLLESIQTCLLSLIEISLVALVLPLGDMIARNINGSVGETELVSDSLNLLLLHFLRDCGAKVLRTVFGLLFQLLLLYFCEFFWESTTVNYNLRLTLSQSVLCRFF